MEFDDEGAGEEALEKLNNLNMGGLRLHIEWSKSSGRYNPDNARRYRSRSRSRDHGRGSRLLSFIGRNTRIRYRPSPTYSREENWSYSVSVSPKR